MSEWVSFTHDVSFGDLLQVIVLVPVGAIAAYEWWKRARTFVFRFSLEPFDVPAQIELLRRLRRKVTRAPGTYNWDLCCQSLLPWDARYIDIRFVQQRHWWLPVWLPLPWYRKVDNAFATTASVTNIQMLTRDGMSANPYPVSTGTTGECRLDLIDQPHIPVGLPVWLRVSVELRRRYWKGYLSLRAPIGGYRRIGRFRVVVTDDAGAR